MGFVRSAKKATSYQQQAQRQELPPPPIQDLPPIQLVPPPIQALPPIQTLPSMSSFSQGNDNYFNIPDYQQLPPPIIPPPIQRNALFSFLYLQLLDVPMNKRPSLSNVDFNGATLELYSDQPQQRDIFNSKTVYTEERRSEGDELLTAMDEHEIKLQLKKLQEVYSAGFIQQVEYDERRKVLEYFLNSKAKRPSKPSQSKKSGDGVSSMSLGELKKRNVRLFLSSTFRDMQSERDELVKSAFPTIKSFCSQRGVFFTEVDLR